MRPDSSPHVEITSPHVEIASSQLAVRSSAPTCMVGSSLREVRAECVSGLLVKWSPCLIESPLHLQRWVASPNHSAASSQRVVASRPWIRRILHSRCALPPVHHGLSPFARSMRCARRGLAFLGIATTQRTVRSGVFLDAIDSALRSMLAGSPSEHVVESPLLCCGSLLDFALIRCSSSLRCLFSSLRCFVVTLRRLALPF